MDSMFRWLRKTSLIGACALSLCAGISHSQVTTQKIVMSGSDGTVYLIDLASNVGVPLSIHVNSTTNMYMSPDQSQFAMFGTGGISVYQLSGMSAQKTADITQAPVSTVAWSTDSKTLVYMQEIENSDGSMTVQISAWNRETGQTKRLL